MDGLGAVTYSFRDAWNADLCQQSKLLRADEFGKAAKARGVDLGFGSSLRERLEDLDRAGALRPVLFSARGDPWTLGESALPVFRDEVEYRPWKEYEPAEPRYSRWQLLYVRDAVDLGVARVSLDWLLDEQRGVSEGYRDYYAHQDRRWRELDAKCRPVVLVLVRLQNRYWPRVRGSLTRSRSTMVFDPVLKDYIDPYLHEVRTFDPPAVLDELGITSDAVRELHHKLAVQGIVNDPLRRFHMLFRMAPYDQRAKLHGDARLSQEAHDAAEVLRRFYHDLTGDLLPASDEIFDLSDGGWKERLLGHGPRLSFSPSDLNAVLRMHRLYPHVVHCVLEGETDQLVVAGLIRAWSRDPGELGITFSTLNGVGRARMHVEVLRAARRYARFPVLIVDREADIERDIERLIDDGLLDRASVFFWDRSLEEDNFTHGELLEMVSAIGRRKGASLDLDADDLRAKHEGQRERLGNNAQGLAEFTLRLARAPAHGSVVVSKPELADEITTRLAEELRRDGEAARGRPVIPIVESILRML